MSQKLVQGVKHSAKAVKKESRVALVKRSPQPGLIYIFILRGVKGLEKAFVVGSDEEVVKILKKFSATCLDVEQVEASISTFPQQLRGAITAYANLLERLSSEITSLVG